MIKTFDDLNDERDRIFISRFLLLGWIATVIYFFMDYAAGARISMLALGTSGFITLPLGAWLFKKGRKFAGHALIYFSFSADQYGAFLSYGNAIHNEYFYFALLVSTFLVIDPEDRKSLYTCVSFPFIFWAAHTLGRDFLPAHLKVNSVASEYEPVMNYLLAAVLCLTFLRSFLGMMARLKSATIQEEEDKRQRLQQVHNELELSRVSLIHTSKLSSLGEMASGVAHEINNPLAIIELNAVSLSRYLEKKFPADTKINKHLSDIENTVHRIGRIISGLRTISRKDSGKDLTFVSVLTILDDVLGLCQERFRVHGVELIIEDEAQVLDQEIQCHRVQISQVFINILNNAYDAVMESDDKEKWIRITFSRSTSRLDFRIANSGKKIADNIAGRLFEPFFTTKEIGKGTGIGLSISKNIIEDHKGHITLDRSADHTSFVIDLPLEHQNEDSMPSVSHPLN